MRPGTLSRTRIFRTDPALDAEIAAAAEREAVTASDWIRRALASVAKPMNRHAHVPAEHIASVWPEVSAMIEAACARPGCDHTADSLRGICERQEGGLILVLDDNGKPAAAGVLQVRQHESGRMAAWVLALGGRRVIPWAEVIAVVEARARMVPCSIVEFVGRRAWGRLLPDYVAEPCETGVHYSKRLGH